MTDDRPKCEGMSLEEATISNMWEMAALVQVRETKSLGIKQGLHVIVSELFEDAARDLENGAWRTE